MKSSPRSRQLEKARVQQQRPNTAKNKYINKILKNKTKKIKRNLTQPVKLSLPLAKVRVTLRQMCVCLCEHSAAFQQGRDSTFWTSLSVEN